MKQKGFTFIELMIVLAIVVILLSIFIPAISSHNAKKKAQEISQETPVKKIHNIPTIH